MNGFIVEPRTQLAIELPPHIHWKGTEGQLARLMKSVWETYKEASSPTPTGQCGRAQHVCSMCRTLNEQRDLDRLLWAYNTRGLWGEYGEVPRDEREYPYPPEDVEDQGG